MLIKMCLIQVNYNPENVLKYKTEYSMTKTEQTSQKNVNTKNEKDSEWNHYIMLCIYALLFNQIFYLK